jgi:hypothetical protein
LSSIRTNGQPSIILTKLWNISRGTHIFISLSWSIPSDEVVRNNRTFCTSNSRYTLKIVSFEYNRICDWRSGREARRFFDFIVKWPDKIVALKFISPLTGYIVKSGNGQAVMELISPNIEAWESYRLRYSNEFKQFSENTILEHPFRSLEVIAPIDYEIGGWKSAHAESHLRWPWLKINIGSYINVKINDSYWCGDQGLSDIRDEAWKPFR